MRIYIGRWDLLPKEWGNIAIENHSEKEIREEVARQRAPLPDQPGLGSYSPKMLINEYSLEEFEATFNNDLKKYLNTDKYWIRIFKDNKSVEQKLKECINTLKEIKKSGYIPFASPAPCSTEQRIKSAIEFGIMRLEDALYWHNQEFGNGKLNPMRLPSSTIIDKTPVNPMKEIKAKAKELANLNLNFGYKDSDKVVEMERIARLVFDHFGLDREISIIKYTHNNKTEKINFILGGIVVSSIRLQHNCKYAGQAAVTDSVQNLLSEAFEKKYPKHSEEIRDFFNPWNNNIFWHYGKI